MRGRQTGPHGRLRLLVVLAALLAVTTAWAQDGGDPTSPPPDNGGNGPTSPFPGIPGIPEDPDTVDRNCRLLGPFALFTQAIMGVFVVGSLVLKRQRERPKRQWKIWLLDISKQMLGQLFVHILNVVLSSLGSMVNVGGEDNPCSLYFLNIGIDTTIGVVIIYYSMRYLTRYFTDVLGLPGFVSGQYYAVTASQQQQHGEEDNFGPSRPPMEDRPSVLSVGSTASHAQKTIGRKKPKTSYFLRQLALYLVSLLLMKIFVLILFAIFPFLFDIGHWVLDLFGQHKKAQIVFVMALFPLLMNTVQFWLIDSVLRHNPDTSPYRTGEDDGIAQVGNGSSGNDFHGRVASYHDDEDGEDLERGGRVDAASGGPWTSSWWSDLVRGSQQGGQTNRGAYQEVGRHSIGEASEDTGEDEEHTYPPVASQSSSVGQLDDGLNGDSAKRQEGPSGHAQQSGTARVSANGSKAGVPALESTTANDEEEEEAWDAWGDDDEEDVQDVPTKKSKTDKTD